MCNKGHVGSCSQGRGHEPPQEEQEEPPSAQEKSKSLHPRRPLQAGPPHGSCAQVQASMRLAT